MERVIDLAERGWVPDPLLRAGIRRLLAGRLRQVDADSENPSARVASLVREMSASPVALDVQAANEQHYEVPAAFFERVLGPHLKYSCCYWPEGVDLLAEAEAAMLELTCRRAGLEDGMRILELGCGWGSLSLWMARELPRAEIVSVSNSHGQRRFIEERAAALGLGNLEVVTSDMNDFSTERRFNRVVSVEMFEHMRNYRELLGRISGWLEPHGRLFVHVFCHRSHPYLFETDGRNDWMARNFFTGGLMPTPDLLGRFSEDLVVERQWEVGGGHYEKTALAWLENLDASREDCLEILTGVYGAGEARRWLQRWRMFFFACAELFAYRGGSEWFVSHSLLRHRSVDEVA
jgi:cyclopropane-fatty-acyl-phospholipid synthase